jgi:hypothetical protein
VVTVKARTRKAVDAAILWQPPGAANTNLIQMNFTIPAGETARSVDVIVSRYKEWNWRTQQFAIAFPAGTDVVIEELQFRHWNLYERVGEAFKSFWTFDTFRPFSINFLWGPLIAFNTPERLQMFDALPPFAWSVTRFIYPLLLLAAVIGVIVWNRKKDGASGAMFFAVTFAILWLLFDIRMGAEILSYAVHDLKTYVLREPAQRELRNFGNVYAHLDRFMPIVKKQETFVMLSPIREVYFPLSRYLAYPSIIITDPKAATGVTLWMILDKTDVWVDTGSMLRMNDQVLAGPGKVIDAIDRSNFLFSTAP